MTNYAELHAGVTSYPDNSNYWADLGNYQSYEDHKETMRENRRTDNIWDISYSWEWDNSDNSQTYRDLRRRKELASVGSQFIIAGLVVNRIASLINVKYLADKNMKAVGGVQHVPGGAALTAGIRF